MTPRRALLAVLGVATLLAGCGGDDDAPAPAGLAVELIEPAVQALEERLGGPQRYSEINAIPGAVNLFVVRDDGAEDAWLYRGGDLEPPEAPAPLAHEPFGLDGVDIGAAPRLVEQVEADLPGATVVSAALVVVPEQGLSWALQSRSPRGGLLNVLFTPDGRLVSAYPADAATTTPG